MAKNRKVTITFPSKGSSPSDRRCHADMMLKQFGLLRSKPWKDNEARFTARAKH